MREICLSSLSPQAQPATIKLHSFCVSSPLREIIPSLVSSLRFVVFPPAIPSTTTQQALPPDHSILVELQFRLLRQQRHDNAPEEPHWVLGKLHFKRILKRGQILLPPQNQVQRRQRLNRPAKPSSSDFQVSSLIHSRHLPNLNNQPAVWGAGMRPSKHKPLATRQTNC